MKTRIALFTLLFFILPFAQSNPYAFNWEPYGPGGINTYNVCFIIDDYFSSVVCYDSGIYKYDANADEWIDYSTDMPVWGAYYLDGEKFLVVMGDGTESDGIYAFNPATEEFEAIEYLESPNFLHYDEHNQEYFVGYHLGMVTSSDGYTWENVSSLNGKNIVAMDCFESHYTVSEVDNQLYIWCSHDYGATWTQSTAGTPMLTSLAYDHEGKLYGIFPDHSWSSGLWSSADYGETWEVEFYSIDMSCVGIDARGEVYVGWGEEPAGTEEGLAHYNPDNQMLSFIHDGLPDFTINKITINPTMSALALFCCTGEGVFFSHDYVSLEELIDGNEQVLIGIYPNPVKGQAIVSYELSGHTGPASLVVCQADGKKISEYKINQLAGELKFNTTVLAPGIYYVFLRGKGFSECRKMVVRN